MQRVDRLEKELSRWKDKYFDLKDEVIDDKIERLEQEKEDASEEKESNYSPPRLPIQDD